MLSHHIMFELTKVQGIIMQKLTPTYLCRRSDSFDHMHINQDPHYHNSKCDLPIACFWTVDAPRNDEVVRYQKDCVGVLV